MNDAIQGLNAEYSNPFAVLLAGGVGGGRAARSLLTRLSADQLMVVCNVGDDDRRYGVPVSADLDTLIYTLAGIEGPEGWGIRGDTFSVLDRAASLGIDTTFRLGDRDLATCLVRATMLDSGNSLSDATTAIRASLGIDTPVLPASNDPVRTKIRTIEGRWLAFQEYFVERGHRDEVAAVEYAGAADAAPAPGVLEAIEAANIVVIAPSNPPLSIAPILAIPEIGRVVERHPRVVAISPLFGGKALKGPADRVMISLGYPEGNAGVIAAYDGFITDLVIDDCDATDASALAGSVAIHTTDTKVLTPAAAARFGVWFEGTFA